MVFLAQFSLSIIILDRLWQITHADIVAEPLWVLLGAACGSFLLSLSGDVLGVCLEKKLLASIVKRVASSHTGARSDELARLLGRDLDLVLDCSTRVFRLVGIPLALLLGASYVLVEYGTIQAVLLLGIGLFVPVSLGLGLWGRKLVEGVMKVSRLRFEAVERWLKWSAYFLNWRVERPLRQLTVALAMEMSVRNLDSMVRSAESYLAVFGRVLPVVLVIGVANAMGLTVRQDPTLLWLIGPLLALTLEFGRLLAELEQGEVAYESFAQLIPVPRPPSNQPEALTAGRDWELWAGSVRSNLLGSLPAARNALRTLGLAEELGPDAIDRELTARGANVSAGQRSRLLICRAVGLAADQGRELDSQIPLSSLDSSNRARVERLLADMATETIPKVSSVPSPAEGSPLRDVAMTSASRVSPRTSHGAVRSILRVPWTPAALGFLLPAAGLGYVGAVVGSGRLSEPTQMLLVAAVFAAALAVAIGLGRVVEGRIRAWARIRAGELLRLPPRLDFGDLLQRGTKDVTTVVERVAWYTHDISWISALMVTAGVSIIFTTELLGLALVVAIVAVTWAVWSSLLPIVAEARRVSIESHTMLLHTTEQLIASNHLLRDMTDGAQFRRSLIRVAYQKYYDARARMLLSKTCLTRWVELASYSALVAASGLMATEGVPASVAAFVLTVGLAASGHVAQFFLALAGLVAQSVSVDRLAPETTGEVPSCSALDETDEVIISGPLTNSTLGVSYDPIRILRGCLTSLTGVSGSGKTQFLRALTGFGVGSGREGVYYLDGSWRTVAGLSHQPAVRDLQSLIAGFPNPKLLVLDEVFADSTEEQAAGELGWLQGWLKMSSCAALLVDHRLRVAPSLAVQSLLRRAPERANREGS